MISHKCYSNPHVLMMRSKASKDSSRGFQVSSKISFLINVRKVFPTSGQTVNVTLKKILVWELNGPIMYQQYNTSNLNRSDQNPHHNHFVHLSQCATLYVHNSTASYTSVCTIYTPGRQIYYSSLFWSVENGIS